jgi:hypothetical protein
MNRKQTKTPRTTVLAVCLSAIGAMPAAAVIDPTFDTGDLILGVQSSASTAFVFEFNVGAPLLYKAPGASFLVGNINSQLNTLGGATWYDSPNLFFGIAGANNNTSISAGTANSNGDFNSTIYASRARLGNGSFGLADSSPWSMSAGQVTNAASPMVQTGGTFDANDTNGIAQIATSLTNEWSDFNPVTGTAQNPAYNSVFTTGIQFRFDTGTFDTGGFGGLTNVEGVVDLFRVARFTNGGSIPGQGLYLGSFAIERDGDVHFIPTPEPGSAALLAIGLASIAGWRSRRRNS